MTASETSRCVSSRGKWAFYSLDREAAEKLLSSGARKRGVAGDRFEVYSAGIDPTPEIHPCAVEAMSEVGGWSVSPRMARSSPIKRPCGTGSRLGATGAASENSVKAKCAEQPFHALG